MPSDFLDHWTIFAELMTPTKFGNTNNMSLAFRIPKRFVGRSIWPIRFDPKKKQTFSRLWVSSGHGPASPNALHIFTRIKMLEQFAVFQEAVLVLKKVGQV